MLNNEFNDNIVEKYEDLQDSCERKSNMDIDKTVMQKAKEKNPQTSDNMLSMQGWYVPPKPNI